MRGDKYARANGLAKIFEELLSRHAGNSKAAKEDMDNKLGKEWQLEIVIEDEEGPEFIDKELLDDLDSDDFDGEDIDEMFKNARQFSETFVRPGDDMEYDPSEKPKEEKKSEKEEGMCISDMLRKLADALEKKG